MTVKVTKPAINVREELADLRKPSGTAGEAMLRAETPQEQFQLIGAGRRNLIINGDMRIAQRGTSATGTGQYAADRWKTSENTGGTTTVSQQSDGPYTPDGHFKYYTQINVDSPDTSLSATEYAGLFYNVEGYDFEPAGYGTSNAKAMSLSFWHCHSEAGIYSISMRNGGGGSNRNYVLDYTQDTGGVWQKTVITFEGATDGTWAGTNSTALSIFFTFAQGSQYATSTLNKWFTGTYYHASTNISNMMATTNAKFRITGVQLELGTATPFEHRPISEELAACQRYFYQHVSGASKFCGMGDFHSASQIDLMINLPVSMRATPALVQSTGTNYFNHYSGGTGRFVSAAWTLWTVNSGNTVVSLYATSAQNGTAGQAARIVTNSSGAKLAFNAEL